jgi:hypothetical protein
MPPREVAAPAATTVPPLAQVHLAIKATYDIEKAILDIRGLLIGSYILSQNCVLTGGFAIVAFGKDDPETGAKAGEFVATIGGYFPGFSPKRWYPNVPRLGLVWKVSDHLEVKGAAYFALTSGAVMAGGSLDAHWEDGSLSARLTLAADFLLAWEPYHYWASFSVAITGSLKWSFIELSVSLLTAVTLHGPPFGGVAVIDLDVVSVTIEFGPPDPSVLPLPADRFAPTFLPSPSTVCGASVTSGGLTRNGEVWSVAPHDLRIEVHSCLPPTTIHLGQDAFSDLAAAKAPSGGGLSLGTEIDASVRLAPCARVATTPLAFVVFREHAGGTDEDCTHRFDPLVQTKALPGSLYASAANTGPDPDVVMAAGAVTLTLPEMKPTAALDIPLDRLRTEELNGELPKAVPQRLTLGALDAVAAPTDTLTRNGVRDATLRALGFDPDTTAWQPRPTGQLAAATMQVAAP